MRSASLIIALLLHRARRSSDKQVRLPAAFDVVSIKPSQSGVVGEADFRVNPSGRVEWTNTTLQALIRMAYQRFAFDPREVVGGPCVDRLRTFRHHRHGGAACQQQTDGFPERTTSG